MKWNLNHIYNKKAFDSLYVLVEKDIKRLKSYLKKLDPCMSSSDFRDFIVFSEKLKSNLSKLSYRPHLEESVNQKSSSARLAKSKVKDLIVKYKEQNRKIQYWLRGKNVAGLKQLDNKSAKKLFSSVKDLEYVLSYDREFISHTLSMPEEDVIAKKDINGVDCLMDMRTLIETEFTYKFKAKKSKKSKTISNQSELTAFCHSNDPVERESAYNVLLTKYRDNIDKFFMIYQAVVKDWVYEASLRNYKTSISVRNKDNHIPDDAISTLLAVCSENKNIFHKYFRFKAKLLGMKKLRRYDIYAPINFKDKTISFEESKSLVLNTLGSFSSTFKTYAEQIINDVHIDVYPSAFKQGGAFCATVSPDITPYVLLNFNGRLRSVLTLAHELGHGIHSIYANKHSYSSQGANIPLSETASTLCETIVFDQMIEQESDRTLKKSLLVNKLADSYATILRQNYFVIFEQSAHEIIPKGIDAEGLSELYLTNLKEQFGRSVKIDDIFKYEWAYIPHIVHTPFYCYAYNFGQLLALALYNRYLKTGPEYLKVIENILEAGGSVSPVKLLKSSGVDIASEQFWQGSFDIINRWQKELEKL